MTPNKGIIYSNLGRETRYTYPLGEIARDISSVKTVIGVFSKENEGEEDPQGGVGKMILDNWDKISSSLEIVGVDTTQRYNAILKNFNSDNVALKLEQVVQLATDMIQRARISGYRHFYLDISSGRRMLAGLVTQAAHYILAHSEHEDKFWQNLEFIIVTRPVDSKKEAKNPIPIETPNDLELETDQGAADNQEKSKLSNSLVVHKLAIQNPPVLDFYEALILYLCDGLPTHEAIRKQYRRLTGKRPPSTGTLSKKIKNRLNQRNIELVNKRGTTNNKKYQRTNLGDVVNDLYVQMYHPQFREYGLAQ